VNDRLISDIDRENTYNELDTEPKWIKQKNEEWKRVLKQTRHNLQISCLRIYIV
jgi:hypothetical protein